MSPAVRPFRLDHCCWKTIHVGAQIIIQRQGSQGFKGTSILLLPSKSQSTATAFCWHKGLPALPVGGIRTRRKLGLISSSSHHCGTWGTSSPPQSGSISRGQMGTTPESVGALTLLVSLDTSVFGNPSSLFWLKQKEEILL